MNKLDLVARKKNEQLRLQKARSELAQREYDRLQALKAEKRLQRILEANQSQVELEGVTYRVTQQGAKRPVKPRVER